MHVLRKALGDDALQTEGHEVRLNTGIVASDVDKFRDARARGDLAAAIDVYGGPFMDGFFLDGAPHFEQWQQSARLELGAELEDVLQHCAEVAESEGDWRAGVACWRRLSADTPERAEFALRLMRALDATGDRGGAI